MLRGSHDGSNNEMTPKVACILATRDRPRLLEGALEALVKTLRDQDEAVVVDSGGRDPGIRRLVEDAGATHVRLRHRGASLARNVGVGATTAPLLAFTDDDCLVAEDWTEAVERAFRDPRVGFMTGRALPDHEHGLPVSVLLEEQARRFEGDEDPFELGHGANMAVRRTAFEDVGGFDHALGAGGALHSSEDKDVFWRVLRAGWHGVFDPRAVVVHRQWRSTAATLRLSFHYGIGAGALAMKGVGSSLAADRSMLRATLWDRGIRRAAQDLRAGYERGAATSIARTVGASLGALTGAGWPLEGGRYRG